MAQDSINADFSRLAIVHGGEARYEPSPMAGVERIKLDRIGGEVARATSLVRYAAGSRFSAHVHGGGEEFLVLEGTFSDDAGDYGPGTYVRNPIGSSHAPWSDEGCLIFVKLHQMAPSEINRLVVDSRQMAWQQGLRHDFKPLFEDEAERVRLIRVLPGFELACVHGYEECLVLSGTVQIGNQNLGPMGWARVPAGAPVRLDSKDGAVVWLKSRLINGPFHQGASWGVDPTSRRRKARHAD